MIRQQTIKQNKVLKSKCINIPKPMIKNKSKDY